VLGECCRPTANSLLVVRRKRQGVSVGRVWVFFLFFSSPVRCVRHCCWTPVSWSFVEATVAEAAVVGPLLFQALYKSYRKRLSSQRRIFYCFDLIIRSSTICLYPQQLLTYLFRWLKYRRTLILPFTFQVIFFSIFWQSYIWKDLYCFFNNKSF